MPFGGQGGRTATQDGNAKAMYPSWARNYHTRGCGTWPAETTGTTRYEQLMTAINTDEHFQREVMLGKRIGMYKFRGELGTGNFSRVSLGFHQLAHERVAIKIIEKTGMDEKSIRMLSREIANMDTVRHPAIVRLFEVLETISRVYLVMEVAPFGEMFTRITNQGRYEEATAQQLFSQLVSAIEFMHSNDLYHRDIKAENVFLASADRIVLGDFGFSTREKLQDQMLTTFCGSPPYAAPELFCDDSYLGASVDIWALGVLLFFMVTATMPFVAQTVVGLKTIILETSYLPPSYLSESCLKLIRGILKREPTERCTLIDIRNSPWLQGQTPLQPLPLYHFIPTSTDQQVNELEKRVVDRLGELGISQNMLEENRDKDGRSPIIGTYRILMYRMGTDNPGMESRLQVPSNDPDVNSIALSSPARSILSAARSPFKKAISPAKTPKKARSPAKAAKKEDEEGGVEDEGSGSGSGLEHGTSNNVQSEHEQGVGTTAPSTGNKSKLKKKFSGFRKSKTKINSTASSASAASSSSNKLKKSKACTIL